MPHGCPPDAKIAADASVRQALVRPLGGNARLRRALGVRVEPASPSFGQMIGLHAVEPIRST